MKKSTILVLGVVSWAAAEQAKVPVIGVRSGINAVTKERPARQDINSLFARGGEHWDLYVQALSVLQKKNETDQLSYFQIAGIHGLPFVSWDGVENVDGAPTGGYCPHNELIFGTWHRPYVALFEQILVSHASEIASQYSSEEAPAYIAAAKTLRQPYWDWAAVTELPAVMSLVNVTVKTPEGLVSVRNPLYSYQFQRNLQGSGFGGPLSDLNRTVRCPTKAYVGDNSTAANSELALSASSVATQVYYAFTRTTTFDQVSHFTGGNDFETPHNTIHSTAGCGNGTLFDINYSAFDPLFMLHHANVDRLLALWQAIYYNDTMFNSSSSSSGQFGTAPGTIITADSPLKPFFDENLNFHTSRSVRDIKTFGYTYPEINDWDWTAEELSAHVRARVNALYDKESDSSMQSQSRVRARWSRKYYTAEVRVERGELKLPVVLDFATKGNFLGRMAILNSPTVGMATASLPIGDMLHRLNLVDMRAEAVVPFLQDHLRVRIRQSDGTVVSSNSTPSLQVEVRDVDYVPRVDDTSFPTYGAPTVWPVGKIVDDDVIEDW